jgi:hypothetical protein
MNGHMLRAAQTSSIAAWYADWQLTLPTPSIKARALLWLQ